MSATPSLERRVAELVRALHAGKLTYDQYCTRLPDEAEAAGGAVSELLDLVEHEPPAEHEAYRARRARMEQLLVELESYEVSDPRRSSGAHSVSRSGAAGTGAPPAGAGGAEVPVSSEVEPEAVTRGRQYIRFAALALVALNVCVGGVAYYRNGPSDLPRLVVRLLLTIAIAVALARGNRWARWLVLLLVVGAMWAALPVLAHSEAFRSPHLPGTLVLLAIYTGYAILGRAMLWSDSVSAFFRWKRPR